MENKPYSIGIHCMACGKPLSEKEKLDHLAYHPECKEKDD